MWVAFLAVVTWGEIYQFQKEAVPAARTLKALYTFYINVDNEKGRGKKNRVHKVKDGPYVEFHDLELSNKEEKREPNYRGVQLGIVPYADFWQTIDDTHFCCDEEDVEDDKCRTKNQMIVQSSRILLHTVRGHEEPQEDAKRFPVTESGPYVLIFSNCGERDDLEVDGSIVVRNPGGYLPASDVKKVTFYQYLSTAYLVLGVLWFLNSMYWWEQIFRIQSCITGVIALSMLEAWAWFVFYSQWNDNGIFPRFLLVMAIFTSVVKTVVSYLLVLVASMGWGITKPFLESFIVKRIVIIGVTYIVFESIRELVMVFRTAHTISGAFVLLCVVPVSFLNAFLFWWITVSLSELLLALELRKQSAKLVLFRKLWWVLVLALVIGVLTLMYQIFVYSRDIADHWEEQWILQDFVGHSIFFFVLIAMMLLWAPHSHSQLYTHFTQLGDGKDDDERGEWGVPDSGIVIADDDDDDWGPGDDDDKIRVIGRSHDGGIGVPKVD